MRRRPRSTLFPYTTLFRSAVALQHGFDRRGERRLRVARHVEQRHFELGERSEEHTSELQSRQYLVCRLLLEKKKVRSVLLVERRARAGILTQDIIVSAKDR